MPTRGLEMLVQGIIDYAGLFPPAELPLEEAIRNYAAYRTGDHRWMLARFIIPARRLAELDEFAAELLVTPDPFRFSVLPPPAAAPEELAGSIRTALEAVAVFHATHPGRVLVDALEVRLPDPLVTAARSDEIRVAMAEVLETISSADAGEITVWFEAPLTDDAERELPEVFDALADLDPARRTADPDGPRPGFKLRCGGVSADAFPSPIEVARVIAGCAARKVPLKFTAGLHHPLRHFNDSVSTRMHGFLNVFVASLLAHSLGWTPEQLGAVLEDEDPRSFRLEQSGVSWKDHHLDLDEISRGRAEFATSYGSCSFDEPRDDLRGLGHL